jgi:hypothetical protein
MRKHAYIENENKAWCSDESCGFRCTPVPEEDSQFNTFFLSDCCSAKIVEEDGSEWTAEICEGNPEP